MCTRICAPTSILGKLGSPSISLFFKKLYVHTKICAHNMFTHKYVQTKICAHKNMLCTKSILGKLPSHFLKKEAGGQSFSDKNIEYQIGKLDTAAKLNPVAIWFSERNHISRMFKENLYSKKRKHLQRKEAKSYVPDVKENHCKENRNSGAMTTQSDCWKYDIDRCCWRKMIFRKLFFSTETLQQPIG